MKVDGEKQGWTFDCCPALTSQPVKPSIHRPRTPYRERPVGTSLEDRRALPGLADGTLLLVLLASRTETKVC